MAKCLTPVTIDAPDGRQYLVRCRQCRGCHSTHQCGWVLAALAEAQTAVETWTITLTYAPGQPGENWLLYSDIQKLFKRLRKAGHQFRYLCAGEYGGKKGRPHWHLMIFWQSPAPDRGTVIGHSDCGTYERRHWPYWKKDDQPIGHVVIDPTFDYKTARYVAKYITKAEGGGKFTSSKCPGIGQDYFDDHALRQGRNGSPPTKNMFTVSEYTHPISENRWKRYRTICQEAYIEAGHGNYVPHPAYERIIPEQERDQMRDDATELYKLEQAQAGPIRPYDVKIIKQSGKNLVALYRINGQDYMRLRIEHTPERIGQWLHGYAHLSDGTFADLAKEGQRVWDIALNLEQMAQVANGKRPHPCPDPTSNTDLLTELSARRRKKSGIPSQASKDRALFCVATYAALDRAVSCSRRGQ